MLRKHGVAPLPGQATDWMGIMPEKAECLPLDYFKQDRIRDIALDAGDMDGIAGDAFLRESWKGPAYCKAAGNKGSNNGFTHQ